MAEFGAGFKVTGNVSQFVGAMKEAGDAAKGLKRGLGDMFGESAIGGLTKFVSFGGALMALKQGISAVLNTSQELRDEADKYGTTVDSNIRRAAAFADAWDGAMITIKDGLVGVGAGIVKSFDSLIGGLSMVFLGLKQSELDMAEASIRQMNNRERIRQEAYEKQKRDAEALKKAEESLVSFREQSAIKRASDEEKVRLLSERALEIGKQQAALDENSTQWKTLQLEKLKLLEQMEDATAQHAEKKKKAYEGIAKLADEYADAIIEEGIEIENNNRLMREQADAAARTAQETRNAAEAQEHMAAATMKAVSAMAPLRGGSQFNEASDETLRAIVSKNRAQAERLRGDVSRMTPFGNLGSMEAARLEQEARNAESVLDARNQLRRSVKAFGVEGARQSYSGDPLMFDQVVQRWVQDSRSNFEVAKEGNQLLKDLNDRLLKAGFGK